MKFTIDIQSLKDLNILGKYQSNSVFNFFNKVKTSGGEKVLDKMFREPLTNEKEINERTATFLYLQKKEIKFPFSPDQMEAVSHFLEMSVNNGNLISSGLVMLRKKIAKDTVKSSAFDEEKNDLIQVISWLCQVSDFVNRCKDDSGHSFQQELMLHGKIFQDTKMQHALNEFQSGNTSGNNHSIGLVQMIKWGQLLKSNKQDLYHLLNWIYWIDAVLAITGVAEEKKMIYGKALPASDHILRSVQLRHPLLDRATANDIHLTQKENVIFLTGANMAGKSTWMKTIGVSFYLAHMGFPLAAEEFEFSVSDGIYSSINVPDNLSMGFSHFYAEVLRVKEVASEVSKGKNLLVLFDELFKGTNVKDAFDATYAVTKAFAAFTNCRFIISTHIIEVGEELMGTPNIQFRYMPTIMRGTVPYYTYNMTPGITTDRQGMVILENEKILEMLA